METIQINETSDEIDYYHIGEDERKLMTSVLWKKSEQIKVRRI